MTDQSPQQKYQVRFDWGVAGFASLAAQADAIILVDVLHTDAPIQLPHTAALVVRAGLVNRTAAAEWVLARQTEKGGLFSVAVIASGAARSDGSIRFAVEDLLAAGAVIDALIGLGLDHCSPEAAAASAAFVGLRQAVRHLVSASESGQQLVALGREAEVRAAAHLDVSAEVVGKPGSARAS